MYDLVIRGASVVDGTGAPAANLDVAIEGTSIAEVSTDVGAGREEVQAEGLTLMPGWVDIHTHYDAQVLWDAQLVPSSWHGVTTTIFGNCGIGLAPASPSEGGRRRLASLLEGVEEISTEVLGHIVDWSWESFPDYLDRISTLNFALDVGAYMAHGPLRIYAMGERGADPDAVPTADELERMRRLAREAVEAGAFGFSTSRSQKHRTSHGEPAPSIRADESERRAIATGLGEAGRGVIEAMVDFAPLDSDFAVLKEMGALSGRPVTFPLVQRNDNPEQYREILEMVRAARGDGVLMFPQVAPRPIGVLLGLGTGRSPFRGSPTYSEIEKLPPAARLQRLRDPSVREKVLGELDDEAMAALGRACELGDPPDYFPSPQSTLAARSAATGTTSAAIAYDLMLEDDGGNLLFLPGTNFASGDSAAVRSMLESDLTVLGLSDGGAHYSRTCDVSFPTYLLTDWVSTDKNPAFPLEQVVRWQTGDNASMIGLSDRGVIKPGFRADLNLVDLPGLRLRAPRLIDDVPGGGTRMVQPVDGYEMTLVAGTRTQVGGKPTGELPGRLVRSR